MIKRSWVGNSKNIYFLPQQNQCCETNTDLKSQVFSPGDHRLHWEQAESYLLKCSGIAPRYQEMINALGCHQRSKKSRNTHNFLSTWKSQLRFSKEKDHCSRSKKIFVGEKREKKSSYHSLRTIYSQDRVFLLPCYLEFQQLSCYSFLSSLDCRHYRYMLQAPDSYILILNLILLMLCYQKNLCVYLCM